MMFTAALLLVAHADPLFTGDQFAAVAAPYISCINRQYERSLPRFENGEGWAADEADAREREARIKAKILAGCASKRRAAASRGTNLLKRGSDIGRVERQQAVERFLKEIDQTLVPPIVVPVIVPLQGIPDAAN